MVPPTQLHGVPSILDYQWDESYWNAEHQQQMLNVKSSEWCAILDGKLFIIYSKLADQCGKNRKTQLAADQTVGGHAVVGVGYDDAKQWFIVRNSWGNSWGMKGYFTLPYSYLTDNNLADDFWTIRIVQ